MRAASWTSRLRERQFERIWRAHQPKIWRLTARLAGSVDLADDLTQEVAVRAFQAFDGFLGRADVYSWLYRIAVNVVIRARERKTHPTVSLESSSALTASAKTASPETQTLAQDLRSRIWQALDRLPEEQRTTLILQVYEGLAYREIASVLDIPIGTVKSRLNAAVTHLRKELGCDDL
jgi:RNA polymerase sigma-70 factor (ECF subfamily)